MQVIKIPITQIVCNEWNPNVMSAKQRQALNESLQEFGDILPLVVRKVDDNYQIVDGQHRFESLQSLPEVDCVVIDVSDTQAMRLTQILNRTRGEDDPERLADLLETLSSQISIEELINGMPIDSEAEFNELLEGLQAGLPQDEEEDFGGGLTGDDEMPDEVKTRVKRGDIWELGRHRIMCGDSTSREDVAQLIDEAKIKLLFTSPPYSNMRQYEEGTNLDIDYLSNIFSAWDVDFFAVNLGLQFKDFEVVPYWDGWITKAKSQGLKLLAWNVWDKTICGSISSATNMFALTHEWIFVFGKERIKLNRIVPNQMDKYEQRNGEDFLDGYNKKVRDYDGSIFETTTKAYTHHQLHSVIQQTPELGKIRENHPAMFPVGLPEKYILSFIDKRETVADCFLGSGSTLIAAEKTDRICYDMELSEHYCDVIIKRWEDYTGDVAIKL